MSFSELFQNGPINCDWVFHSLKTRLTSVMLFFVWGVQVSNITLNVKSFSALASHSSKAVLYFIVLIDRPNTALEWAIFLQMLWYVFFSICTCLFSPMSWINKNVCIFHEYPYCTCICAFSNRLSHRLCFCFLTSLYCTFHFYFYSVRAWWKCDRYFLWLEKKAFTTPKSWKKKIKNKYRLIQTCNTHLCFKIRNRKPYR